MLEQILRRKLAVLKSVPPTAAIEIVISRMEKCLQIVKSS